MKNKVKKNTKTKKVISKIKVSTIQDAVTKIKELAVERKRKFVESVDPIFQRISSITTQIKSLESLRDTLLPRLISGQVRVNEAYETIQ